MSQKKKGILYITASGFFFALMSLFIRLSGDIPLMQKCFFRNGVAFFIAFAILLRSREKITIGKGNLKYLLIRSISGTLGVIFNFYAVDHMNISDASMLNKLSPFFIIIFSGLILKEKAGKIQWAAIFIAFAGALFVIKPTLDGVSMPAVVGVLSGLGAGLAYTYVRRLGMRGVKGPVIVLFFSAFSCMVTLPDLIFNYAPMSSSQLIYLLLAGLAAAGGQITITAAYGKAPAKEISVYDYSHIIFASVLGFLFLGQIPDKWSYLGYGIILGAAFLQWQNNIGDGADS